MQNSASPGPPVVTVQGSSFDRGYQLGSALRDPIQAFLGDTMRPDYFGSKPFLRAFESVARSRAVVIDQMPWLADEVVGLAAGAEIPPDAAWLLQYRREFARSVDDSEALECTTLARSDGSGPSIVQTLDLPGGVARFGCLVLERPTHGPAAWIFTLTGMLGYVGVNEAGIAVGLNMVVSLPWEPGVSPYLLSRALLALDDLDACVRLVETTQLSSSRCFTLADGARVVQVECTGSGSARLVGDRLPHTNHFLAEDLSSADRMNVMLRRSSRSRLAFVQQLADSAPLDSTSALDAMAAHGPSGPCIHDEGDKERFDTIAAVSLTTRPPVLTIRPGRPCTAKQLAFGFTSTTAVA